MTEHEHKRREEIELTSEMELSNFLHPYHNQIRRRSRSILVREVLHAGSEPFCEILKRRARLRGQLRQKGRSGGKEAEADLDRCGSSSQIRVVGRLANKHKISIDPQTLRWYACSPERR